MNKIKELREANNETQEELGKLLNVSKATISKYENGTVEVSNDSLIKLAKHYNTTTDYILGIEKNYKKENNLHQAASSDIDLAKLAKLDKNKKEMVEKTANDMINMFYDEFGNKD